MNKAVLDSGGLVSAFLTPKGVSDVNLVTKLPSIEEFIEILRKETL